MLQVGLLVPHMDKSEYSDKPLVLWFEKSLQFGKKFFVQARIWAIMFGNNSNIRASVKETRKSFTINFDTYSRSGKFRY